MRILEVQISQDIRKYKAKDIGNFSFKEAGFIAVGMAAAFLTYKLTKGVEVAIIPLGITLIIGFFKPYGMSFLQFIRTVGKETFTPHCYINETDFEYDVSNFKKMYGDDVVIPTEWNVIQTNAPVKINKRDKIKIIK